TAPPDGPAPARSDAPPHARAAVRSPRGDLLRGRPRAALLLEPPGRRRPRRRRSGAGRGARGGGARDLPGPRSRDPGPARGLRARHRHLRDLRPWLRPIAHALCVCEPLARGPRLPARPSHLATPPQAPEAPARPPPQALGHGRTRVRQLAAEPRLV